jgi:O-antigen ligase
VGKLPASETLAAVALVAAVLVPSAIALSIPPSPTVVNQAAAWAAWGLVAGLVRRSTVGAAGAAQASLPLLLALSLCLTCVCGSWLLASLPAPAALSYGATLLAAIAVTCVGAAVATTSLLQAWMVAWCIAGLVNATIALVQVFAPGLTDGVWIAHSTSVGRAIGNLRQPNHLASLLLCSAAAIVVLMESPPRLRFNRRQVLLSAALALVVIGVVLTGSRTGIVGVLLLSIWGAVDRRLALNTRAVLIGAPFLFLVTYLALSLAASTQQIGPIGAAQRLGRSELSTGRFQVWHDALQLVSQQPLLGVGFGQFNFAWTLTPSVARWPEFFDHTHNLVLQLFVELGVPIGAAVVMLLLTALTQSWRRVRVSEGSRGNALRATFVMVLIMGLHSMLEYPLWYAHFLLPTAFSWGLCLGNDSRNGERTKNSQAHWPLLVGIGLVSGAALMIWDYHRVSAIFNAADERLSLTERIEVGQRSWFFAHHADYARITTLEETSPPTLGDFRRATYFLLDTRLLIAWANAHARAGDIERARWIADRLRELKQSSAEPYFAPCTDPAVANKPYQCTSASRTFDWRDFK